MAEAAAIELSALTKMCLNRRIADIATYRKEVIPDIVIGIFFQLEQEQQLLAVWDRPKG